MNRIGATGLGVTVGELRAALDKLPADIPIVVRAPDGVCSAIWNAGRDEVEGFEHVVYVLEISDDPDFVRAEDERRKGTGAPPTSPAAERGHPKSATKPRRRKR